MKQTERRTTHRKLSTLIFYFQPWREESDAFVVWLPGRRGFGWLYRKEHDLDTYFTLKERWESDALWWWSGRAGGGDMHPVAKSHFESMLSTLQTEGWTIQQRRDSNYRTVVRLKRQNG